MSIYFTMQSLNRKLWKRKTTLKYYLTLSLLGYLKTRIPPYLEIPCLMPKFDKWYIIGKFLCSTFIICKKNGNLQNKNFFCKIQLYSKHVKKWSKIYIFKKPLTMPFQICKNVCKILNNLTCNLEKLKMCKFLLTGCKQIFWKHFVFKTCAIRFLMS